MKNISENLFEKVCINGRIPFFPVPRQKQTKTPDYELHVGEQIVVVEVKEIQRNKVEQESDRLLEVSGVGLALGGTPGDRVRQKIKSASPQIKARAQGQRPGILVIYDHDIFATNIDPYQILVAMYGLQTLQLAIPQNAPSYVTAEHFGPKRQFSETANTSISAIATIHQFPSGPVEFRVYHNEYAAIPLDVNLLDPFGIKQFCLRKADRDQFRGWEPAARTLQENQ